MELKFRYLPLFHPENFMGSHLSRTKPLPHLEPGPNPTSKESLRESCRKGNRIFCCRDEPTPHRGNSCIAGTCSCESRVLCERHYSYGGRRSPQKPGDGQEPKIHAKGNRHTEHEHRNGSSHHKEDFNVKSLQRTVLMMRRTTEQIIDVSCGNTAALVGIDLSVFKLGTLTTVEDVHNTADTKYGVSPVVKNAVIPKDRRGSIQLDQSTVKETHVYLREQDGLRHYTQQARKVRWDLEQDDELERTPTTRRKFGGNDTNDWEWWRLRGWTALPVEQV